MTPNDVRAAVDSGDVDALSKLLAADAALVTALIATPEIQPTSPLTYVGMARFYGYADHERTGALARVLMDGGADKDDDVELADPEMPSETALRAAAAFGYPEIVDLLVAHGARSRSVIEAAGIGDLSGYDLGELSDRDRANALRAAAVNERLATIDRLLAAGTPVEAESDGHPAIYWAQRQGRDRAVAHLAANGASR